LFRRFIASWRGSIMPALIVKVERSSIADDIGLAPGDTLISIDGKEINDILDYHFWVRSEQLEFSPFFTILSISSSGPTHIST
jgi:hypothetical protein